MLEPHREPHQVGGRGGVRTLARGPVLDQALHAPQGGRPHEHPGPADRLDRGLPPLAYVDGEHAAEAGHLARRHGVPGIVGEARIVHSRDPGVY